MIMDLSTVFNELNYWAVLVAALSNFVGGFGIQRFCLEQDGWN